MTFFEKILVVLILITSIIFAALSLTVYNTHQHWQEIVKLSSPAPGKPLGLRHQLRNKKEKLAQLEEESQRLKNELAAEEAAYRQQLQKLETRRVDMEADSRRLDAELAERGQQLRELTKSVDEVQKNLASVDQQVQQLRAEIQQAQQKRDNEFKNVVVESEAVYEMVGQIERLEERRRQLARQLAHIKEKLNENDIDPHAPVEGTGPRLEGQVTQVSGDGLIQISIGADRGLRIGQTVEIYRGNTRYLGRAEVLRTDPDQAVAKILPKFNRGPIRKGDRVATKLKIS